MGEPLLVIGNYTYSSWSLRAWIGLRLLDVPFRTERIALYQPGTTAAIRRHSPTGLVPVLVDDGLTVHESIAVLEYASEVYGNGRLLPGDPRARALCRAAAAEMHAGLAALRAALPMNLRRPPAPPADPSWIDEPVQRDIARVLEVWEDLLGRSGGPGLCGDWSLADCMYLPVATRLHTYAVDLAGHPRSRDYVARLLALPAFREWEAAARAETEHHAPYER